MYATDNSLSAPINWLYSPDLNTTEMPYLMYALDARLGSQLPELAPGNPVVQDYRATRFEGNTSQALVLFYDPPRCLKTLDPKQDGDLPNKPDFIAEALPLSRLELIQPAQGVSFEVMENLFGPEPAHGWCYYFARAELAAQLGDWSAVRALVAPALASQPELSREQAYELLPYIQAYAYTGEWEEALALSRRSASLFDTKMPAILCDLWQRLSRIDSASPQQRSTFMQAQADFHCSSH
jgi:hypothetical protein